MLRVTSQEDSSITTKVRERAATLALAVTVGLTALKLSIGVISGSVGVLSEALHSFLDLVSAALAYFTIREAGKPADHDHPFGHGKIETLSSLFESLLLIVAAGLIIIEAVDHLFHPHPIHYQGLAIVAIAVSIGVSFWIYKQNREAALQTESTAIHVNALHFFSDVIAGAGVLLGLVLLRLTGWQPIDPIVALGVAIYVAWIAFQQVRGAVSELADEQLPEAERALIQKILSEAIQKDRVIEAHDLRTRKSGATRHVDFHLVVCSEMTVHESHAVCDQIEAQLLGVLPSASINIHVEPCEHEHVECDPNCPKFREKSK